MFFLSIIDLNLLKDRILKHDLLTMAAAIAFYTALALSPLMILLLTFLASLNLSLQQELLQLVQDTMGIEAANLLEAVTTNLSQRPSLLSKTDLWSIGFILFSGSVVFSQVQSSLNVIFDVPSEEDPPAAWWLYVGEYLVRRIICIGVTLTFVGITGISVAASAYLSIFKPTEYQDFFAIIHHLGTYFVYTLVFALLYRWMPDRKVSWRSTLRAGTITAFLFVGGQLVIGSYLNYAALGSAYGAAGSLLVFLAWIYYSALTFLLGAEISSLMSPLGEFKTYRRIGLQKV